MLINHIFAVRIEHACAYPWTIAFFLHSSSIENDGFYNTVIYANELRNIHIHQAYTFKIIVYEYIRYVEHTTFQT